MIICFFSQKNDESFEWVFPSNILNKFFNLVILALIGAATAVAIPLKSQQKDGGPDCGARSAPQVFIRKIHSKSMPWLDFIDPVFSEEATFVCEMCLDLVQVAEMYAECDEAYVDAKMDAKCDSYFHNGFLDKVCRDMIDDLMAELEKDTDKDPAKVCSKVTKTDCHYS